MSYLHFSSYPPYMRAKLIKNIGLANYCFQEAMATPRINKKSTPFVLKGMDNICSFKASPT